MPFCREEKDNLRKENQVLRENEINARIIEFKENGYSLEKLIELAVKVKQSTVGDVLARFYCEGVFDENIFRLLIENEEEGRCAYNYVKCLYSGESVNLNEVIDIVRRMPGKENFMVNLLSLEVIEDYEKACIIGESEDIKKIYWSRSANFCISPKAERKVLVWALDECREYGTLDAYLELLYEVKDKISGLELFDRVFAICDMRSEVPCSMTRYYLEEVLKELQNEFIEDDERCSKLAKLEWRCRNALEWEQMRCMQREMKADPAFYAYLVSVIYKTDNTETVDEGKRELANKLYGGFDKAKFCPAEKNGKVSYEELKNWMEKFRELLAIQKQERLFYDLAGGLLAYSPIGEDDYAPCEAVRVFIEEYARESEALKNSYVIEECNKRGAHFIDAGKSELELYQKYIKNAEALQEDYPRTAEIYFKISDRYKQEAKHERRRAEDEY